MFELMATNRDVHVRVVQSLPGSRQTVITLPSPNERQTFRDEVLHGSSSRWRLMICCAVGGIENRGSKKQFVCGGVSYVWTVTFVSDDSVASAMCWGSCPGSAR